MWKNFRIESWLYVLYPKVPLICTFYLYCIISFSDFEKNSVLCPALSSIQYGTRDKQSKHAIM